MVRRKPGTLLPLEVALLAVAVAAQRGGNPEFHGFEAAKAVRDRDGARSLTAHGTLYKALGRMEEAGLLESRWEAPDLAAAEGRPRRRFYQVTGAGERALAGERVHDTPPRWNPRPGALPA
jgi:PadR family transcriptional regulator, regulatory protein PadR